MTQFNQREYYRTKEEVSKDPKYLDKLIESFLDDDIELVYWDDHISEFGNVRKEIIRGKDGQGNEIVQHDRFDGNVFQEGTPVDSWHLGRMEWNDLINYLKIKYLMDLVRRINLQLNTLVGGISNNMPHNSFLAETIAGDLMVIEGWYDEENGRGVV